MRDPITKLAIVDPAHVEKDIAKAFKELFTIPGRLSLLHYVGRVTRKTRLSSEKKILLVSNSCLYMCKEDNSKKRCIKISAIKDVVVTSDSFIVLKIPTEYDSCFKLHNVAETDYLLNVMRVTKSFTSPDGMPLQVSNHQQISSVNINYSTPSNYVCDMVEIPTLHEVDNRQMAIDAFLAPPPPPVAKGGHPKLAVKEVPTQEAQTILDHPLFDGSMSVPPPRGVMAMSAYGSHAAAAAATAADGMSYPPATTQQIDPNSSQGNGIDPQNVQRLQAVAQALSEQQEAQLEIAKRMKIQEHSMKQSGLPGSGTGGLPGSGTGGLPGQREEASLVPNKIDRSDTEHHTADHSNYHANSPAASESHVAPQWQSPAALQAALSPLPSRGRGSERGSPSTDQQGAMQARIAALERELEDMKEAKELQAYEANRLRHHSPPSSTTTGVYQVTSTPPLYHADPSLSPVAQEVHRAPSVPPAAVGHTYQSHHHHQHLSPPRMTLAEFEASIEGKPLEERLVLRQYQVDERRSKISDLMKGGTVSERQGGYNSIEMFTLQDEMLELGASMNKDLALAAYEDPHALEKRIKLSPSEAATAAAASAASALLGAPTASEPAAVTPQQQAMQYYHQSQYPNAHQHIGSTDHAAAEIAAAPSSSDSTMINPNGFVEWMSQVTSALAAHQQLDVEKVQHASKAVVSKDPATTFTSSSRGNTTGARDRSPPRPPTRSRTPSGRSKRSAGSTWRH